MPLITIIGLIYSIGLIKKLKFIGIGVTAFWILEFLFRDFGMYGFPAINILMSKIIFLVSTCILSIACLRLLHKQGGEV